ncbi:MAG: zinc-ribbon domain-containing protein [Gemmatimonadota bacterium]
MVITVSCPSCATSFPVDPAKIPETGVKVRCSACAYVFRVERPEPEPDASAALPELPEPTPPSEDVGDDALDIERDAFEEVAAAEEPASEPVPEEAPDGGAEMPDWAAAGAEEWSEPATEAAPLPEPEPEAPAVDPAVEAWAAETQPASPADEATEQAPPEPELADAVPEPELAEPEPTESWPEPELPEPTLAEPLPDPEPLAEPEPANPVEPTAAEVQADTPVQGFTFGKRDPMDKARRLARVLVSDMVMYNAERHQEALAQGTLAEDFEEEIDKSWKEFVDQVGGEIADGEGRTFWRQALNDILAKGQSVF